MRETASYFLCLFIAASGSGQPLAHSHAAPSSPCPTSERSRMSVPLLLLLLLLFSSGTFSISAMYKDSLLRRTAQQFRCNERVVQSCRRCRLSKNYPSSLTVCLLAEVEATRETVRQDNSLFVVVLVVGNGQLTVCRCHHCSTEIR
jgi:hypothetical protein